MKMKGVVGKVFKRRKFHARRNHSKSWLLTRKNILLRKVGNIGLRTKE